MDTEQMKTELTLGQWLRERRENTIRLAKQKRGEDRAEWLENASYLARAEHAVSLLVAASADDHGNVPLRMHIALKILRAWNGGTAGYDSSAVLAVNGWIDGGMKGPVPWPSSPFFDEWAKQNGLQKVGHYVGFRFHVKLSD